MAPGILAAGPPSSNDNIPRWKKAPNNEAPRSIFPDEIRTSGQHEPLSEHLRPYSEFPKEITGPTLWKKEDYVNNPEKWTHAFTAEEVQELGEAADRFIERGIPLTGISKVVRTIRTTNATADTRIVQFLSPKAVTQIGRPPRGLAQRQRLHPLQEIPC